MTQWGEFVSKYDLQSFYGNIFSSSALQFSEYILFILFFFSSALFLSLSLYAMLFIEKLWLTGEVPSVLGRLDPGDNSDEQL